MQSSVRTSLGEEKNWVAKKKVCWILGVTNWRDIGKNVSNLCLKECESILDSFLKVRYWTCISIKYKRKRIILPEFFLYRFTTMFLKSYSQMFFRVIPTDLFHR